jgi:hypothetical protein
MSAIKKNISLGLVVCVYLLFNLRYAPESLVTTFKSTLMQLLMTAPFVVGLTILVVSFMQRSTGERLPWDRIARIYCTLGIFIGFFYALSEYWLRAQLKYFKFPVIHKLSLSISYRMTTHLSVNNLQSSISQIFNLSDQRTIRMVS